ncbi:MAG TPA: DNA polymerase III subunit delta, partial [Anaerolineae bacterium]|nr:DNA polymerase III subunit delta [Anaerolineae bacterium]
DLNTTILDGSKVTLAELMHACDSVPFLTDRRLVIVEGLLTRLGAGGKGKADRGKEQPAWKKEYLEELTAYLKRLPETTRLVFVEGKSINPNHPVLKIALADKERGYVKEFRPPTSGKLRRWITDRVERKGGEIEASAAEELAAFVGSDLRLLDQELDKLISYVDRARPITRADVHLLVSYVQQANVFEMVDALGRRDGQQALKLLHRLLEDGKHPLSLLGMIFRQFRIMIQVKELAERGVPPSKIGAQLGLHRFVAEKGLRQSRNFSMEQLETIYRNLLDTDVAIKTGQMEPVLALDILIAELSKRAA